MGKPFQLWHHRRRTSWWNPFYRARLPISLALLCAASLAHVVTDTQHLLPSVHYPGTSSTTIAVRKVGCDIKGNISDRGEHIYHVPGQEVTRRHASTLPEAKDGSAPNGKRGGLGGEKRRYDFADFTFTSRWRLSARYSFCLHGPKCGDGTVN